MKISIMFCFLIPCLHQFHLSRVTEQMHPDSLRLRVISLGFLIITPSRISSFPTPLQVGLCCSSALDNSSTFAYPAAPHSPYLSSQLRHPSLEVFPESLIWFGAASLLLHLQLCAPVRRCHSAWIDELFTIMSSESL